ncbi:MAG: FGGY family carbohydrate kinase [Actinomycetota bacterium]|nr:FGGY family carbohydrate kinase [Actinomycetota bacterium]
MGDQPLLLGLDVGTSRTKALLLDGEGEERRSFTVTTPFAAGEEGREMAVEALLGSLGRLLGGLGDEIERVEAVAVAGLAESGAPLDGRGRPLAPVIAWHDPRGEEAVERLKERFGEGLDRRIGQPLRTVSSVAKLGWLGDHGVEGIRRWLGVPELCLFHLTGEEVTEHSLAARTGAYEVVEQRYMPEVVDALGLGGDVFPPVLAAGSPMGRVSAQGSAWSGLPEGIPVTIGGHDHLAGAEGVGASLQDLVNSVGTAETVMRRSAEAPDVGKALELRTAVTVRPGGGEWVVLASAARAGLVLEAAAGALGRSLAELDDLAREAGEVEVGDDLVRSIQAGDHPDLPEAEPGEVWNGLLRALSERTFESAGRLVELLGPAERLLVFGGGSRSAHWMRVKAQVGDLPVLRTRSPDAVARGAACFAGVAGQWWGSVEDAPRPPLEEAGP